VSVTLEQFVQHPTHSRLLSAAEISSFQDSLPPEKRPQDGETLARALVQANKLTKYQAQVVYQGKVKGLVFGDYRVLDKLGQGGMGVVLKAEHRRMKRVVAVKMISGAALKSPDAVKRFYREVEAAAKLNHPNIVQAYDAGEHEGGHYLVMEYVEGKDLGAIVKEKGPLPIAQAVVAGSVAVSGAGRRVAAVGRRVPEDGGQAGGRPAAVDGRGDCGAGGVRRRLVQPLVLQPLGVSPNQLARRPPPAPRFPGGGGDRGRPRQAGGPLTLG
jgi:hypothetical protein